MNTLQLQIQWWVSAGAFVVAVIGLTSMLVAFTFPVHSTAGKKLFSGGVIAAISAVVIYLLYTMAAVVTTVVLRS